MDISMALETLRNLPFVIDNDSKVKSESWFYKGGKFTKFVVIVREQENTTALSSA